MMDDWWMVGEWWWIYGGWWWMVVDGCMIDKWVFPTLSSVTHHEVCASVLTLSLEPPSCVGVLVPLING